MGKITDYNKPRTLDDKSVNNQKEREIKQLPSLFPSYLF